ncbi:hypothetical protein WMY93_001830 [Mugilogobius chulae]|uniref:Uncharacterized protein n=1 Tax=Mugilogobius chulae TaxID=88201 RepID=A0AAW0Q2Y7_9GOBI
MGYYFHPSHARLPHGDWDQIVFGLRVSGNLLEEDLPALSFDEDDAGELEVGAALTTLHRRYDFVPSEEESGYNSVPEEEESEEEDIPRFQGPSPLAGGSSCSSCGARGSSSDPLSSAESRQPLPLPQSHVGGPLVWSPRHPSADASAAEMKRKEEDEPSSKRRCFSSSEDSSEDSSDDSGPSTSAETSGGFRRYFHCPHLFQDEERPVRLKALPLKAATFTTFSSFHRPL